MFTTIKYNKMLVELNGFVCPDCGKYYLAEAMSQHIKVKVKKIRLLYEKERKCRREGQKAVLAKQRRRLTRETTAEGLALKNEIKQHLDKGGRCNANLR